MTNSDDDERPEGETQDDGAHDEEQQADPTAEAGAGEDEEPDPAVAEIEQDPSRNPPNELLRDIKGG
jgi:hypothetical protein